MMNGNMASHSDHGAYAYNAATGSHPHAPTSVAGQAFQYDANGNMTQGLGGKTMTYDGENRPLSVTHAGQTTSLTPTLPMARG